MYTQFCPNCETSKVVMSSIAERDNQSCPCGEKMKRQMDIPGAVWAPTASSGGATLR